jgi:hypothetical protein
VKQVAVSVGDNLVALLGRRVEADGIIGGVLFGKRDLVVRAVDGTGRSEYKVPAGARANSFEYIHETDQIAGDIFIGTGKGVPYSGLGRKMNHGFELAVAEQTVHPLSICEIEGEEPESGPYAELPKPRILESGIVIIVQVVHTDNLKAVLKKPADDMGANETRGARHQNAFVFYFFHHSSF